MNVVVIRGWVCEEPQRSTTRSGDELCSFEITVGEGAARERVPVTWPDPPLDLPTLGDEVAVRGRVRKRFLRSAAGVRPRTDVVAERVVLVRRRRQLQRLLAEASAALES